MTKLPCIGLNRYAQKRLREKHPWIFSNEITDMKHLARLEPGAMAEVLDCHGDYVGTGFVNSKSLIAVRLLSRKREESIDGAFFRKKFTKALSLREKIYGSHSHAKATYRAVFGESDGLPGLIVDRYGPVWVMEPHALGMELRAEVLAQSLQEAAVKICGEDSFQALVLRTDSRSAALEGMSSRTHVVGEFPEDGVWAEEGGVRFPVNPSTGQKTGFFFDQRENRSAFCRWIENSIAFGEKELNVLDLYCHLGAWGLRALASGATHATFVDQSEEAIAAVKKVAQQYGWENRCTFIVDDAMAAMEKLQEKSFSAIALDPPAFITSKKVATQGLKAYGANNAAAIRLVKNQGILSTSSCSYHCMEERFEEVIAAAARAHGRTPKILSRGGAAWDHPAIAGMAETRYLKNLLLAL